MSTQITPNNRVADHAYFLWEQAGRPHGRDLEFWLQAETAIHSATALGKPASAQPPARHTLQESQRNGSGAASPASSQPRPKQPATTLPSKTAARARDSRANRNVNPPVYP